MKGVYVYLVEEKVDQVKRCVVLCCVVCGVVKGVYVYLVEEQVGQVSNRLAGVAQTHHHVAHLTMYDNRGGGREREGHVLRYAAECVDMMCIKWASQQGVLI